jgi:hypothetical protein
VPDALVGRPENGVGGYVDGVESEVEHAGYSAPKVARQLPVELCKRGHFLEGAVETDCRERLSRCDFGALAIMGNGLAIMGSGGLWCVMD